MGDVLPAITPSIDVLTRWPKYLARDDKIPSVDSLLSKPLTNDLLGSSSSVDLGAVNEVDTLFHCCIHTLLGNPILDSATVGQPREISLIFRPLFPTRLYRIRISVAGWKINYK